MTVDRVSVDGQPPHRIYMCVYVCVCVCIHACILYVCICIYKSMGFFSAASNTNEDNIQQILNKAQYSNVAETPYIDSTYYGFIVHQCVDATALSITTFSITINKS